MASRGQVELFGEQPTLEREATVVFLSLGHVTPCTRLSLLPSLVFLFLVSFLLLASSIPLPFYPSRPSAAPASLPMLRPCNDQMLLYILAAAAIIPSHPSVSKSCARITDGRKGNRFPLPLTGIYIYISCRISFFLFFFFLVLIVNSSRGTLCNNRSSKFLRIERVNL